MIMAAIRITGPWARETITRNAANTVAPANPKSMIGSDGRPNQANATAVNEPAAMRRVMITVDATFQAAGLF